MPTCSVSWSLPQRIPRSLAPRETRWPVDVPHPIAQPSIESRHATCMQAHELLSTRIRMYEMDAICCLPPSHFSCSLMSRPRTRCVSYSCCRHPGLCKCQAKLPTTLLQTSVARVPLRYCKGVMSSSPLANACASALESPS